jgi:hypothetical protein
MPHPHILSCRATYEPLMHAPYTSNSIVAGRVQLAHVAELLVSVANIVCASAPVEVALAIVERKDILALIEFVEGTTLRRSGTYSSCNPR